MCNFTRALKNSSRNDHPKSREAERTERAERTLWQSQTNYRSLYTKSKWICVSLGSIKLVILLLRLSQHSHYGYGWLANITNKMRCFWGRRTQFSMELKMDVNALFSQTAYMFVLWIAATQRATKILLMVMELLPLYYTDTIYYLNNFFSPSFLHLITSCKFDGSFLIIFFLNVKLSMSTLPDYQVTTYHVLWFIFCTHQIVTTNHG